jgi:hypothetical protein
MVMARSVSAIDSDDEIRGRQVGGAIVAVMAANALAKQTVPPLWTGGSTPGRAIGVSVRISVLSVPDRGPDVLLLPTPTASSPRFLCL